MASDQLETATLFRGNSMEIPQGFQPTGDGNSEELPTEFHSPEEEEEKDKSFSPSPHETPRNFPTWSLASVAASVRELLDLSEIPKAGWNSHIQRLLDTGKSWADVVNLTIAIAADPDTTSASRMRINGLTGHIAVTKPKRPSSRRTSPYEVPKPRPGDVPCDHGEPRGSDYCPLCRHRKKTTHQEGNQ